MIKACIFDLDGTLADTLESMAAVANELMDEIGLERQPVDHFRYYCGEGANMLVRRCLKDADDPQLETWQEDTPVQQWLMKNSWKYGFVLRYPPEKSSITGIIYEPWHYRYVGREYAQAIRQSGLCLEEFLQR